MIRAIDPSMSQDGFGLVLIADHSVLTVGDPERAQAFYARVLGMEPVTDRKARRSVQSRERTISFRRLSSSPLLREATKLRTIRLRTDWPVERTLAHLAAEGVEVLEGPATKDGALGPIASVYFQDEDGNLIEIARYEGQE